MIDVDKIKTIENIDLNGKKVIIRVDFNVPMDGNEIKDNRRIVEAIPTILKAQQSGAAVILLSHLGRVNNDSDKSKKSLKPVAEELSRLINMKVDFVRETSGHFVKAKARELQPGEIMMLENTRFEDLNGRAETGNSRRLSKFWASLGDVYIFDAFGTSHRSHASTVGIINNIAEAGIGYLVHKELSIISWVMKEPIRPATAIIGGAKIKDKIKVVDNLLHHFDQVIIGGGMAYTFLKAQGIEVGNSIVKDDSVKESTLIDMAKNYLKKYQERIILPIDFALSPSFENTEPFYNTYNPLEIPQGYMGMDIGPKTIDYFTKIISTSKTVIWNGPVGVYEFSNYAKGTEAIAKAMASIKANKAITIIGGGDSAAAIAKLDLEKYIGHISTGGGACLVMLEGKSLPVIEAIMSPGSQIEKNKKPKKHNEEDSTVEAMLSSSELVLEIKDKKDKTKSKKTPKKSSKSKAKTPTQAKSKPAKQPKQKEVKANKTQNKPKSNPKQQSKPKKIAVKKPIDKKQSSKPKTKQKSKNKK